MKLWKRLCLSDFPKSKKTTEDVGVVYEKEGESVWKELYGRLARNSSFDIILKVAIFEHPFIARQTLHSKHRETCAPNIISSLCRVSRKLTLEDIFPHGYHVGGEAYICGLCGEGSERGQPKQHFFEDHLEKCAHLFPSNSLSMAGSVLYKMSFLLNPERQQYTTALWAWFVFDLSQRTQFEKLKDEIDEKKKATAIIKFLLIGVSSKGQRTVGEEEAREMARTHGIEYLEIFDTINNSNENLKEKIREGLSFISQDYLKGIERAEKNYLERQKFQKQGETQCILF